MTDPRVPRLAAALVASLLATSAAAAAEFAPARPGYHFVFPRDHASHPAYRTEWWYYTGHLAGPGGRRFGYELTFFRVGVSRQPLGPSHWRFADLYPAHFALTDETAGRFYAAERLNRPGLGLAGADPQRYDVFNGTWRVRQEGTGFHLQASDAGRSIDLMLASEKPPVIHGHDGLSRKADCDGCASHYYSLTRLATRGTLALAGERLAVSGQSWMDHEFGSSMLGPHQAGWDWFALQLADGSELMLYHLRETTGRPTRESSGTYVAPNGRARYLPLDAFRLQPQGHWHSPKTGGDYPQGWQLAVPGEGLELAVSPTLADQELVTSGSTGVAYWEGSVAVTGTHLGKPVRGEGYVELTGYAGPMRRDF